MDIMKQWFFDSRLPAFGKHESINGRDKSEFFFCEREWLEFML